MTLNWAPYQAAAGCTKYGPAGAQALLVYTEDVFAELARSLGICNCRPVRGGASWSHHAECRALDIGFVIAAGKTYAYDYARILGEHGARAGIDHIITNRRPWASGRGEPIIFSARSPNGRTYTGAHPHKDHNHNGLTRGAGRNLTYGTLVAIYGRPEEIAARLLLARPTGGTEEMLFGIDIGKTGDPSKGPAEEYGVLQAFLVGQGHDLGEWGPNGDGVDERPGDDTRRALHAWKISAGVTPATSAGEGKIGTYEMAAIYAAGGAAPDTRHLVTREEHRDHRHETGGPK